MSERRTSGRISAVVTDRGTVRCEAAVVCAGLWTPGIGADIDEDVLDNHRVA